MSVFSAVAVACLLLSVCFVGSTTKLVGVGVVIGGGVDDVHHLLVVLVWLCLSPVVALTICPEMQRMFSFVDVSLPSQMA